MRSSPRRMLVERGPLGPDRHLRPRVVARSAVEALEQRGCRRPARGRRRPPPAAARRAERAPARRRSAAACSAVRGPDGPVRRDGDVGDVLDGVARAAAVADDASGEEPHPAGLVGHELGRSRASPSGVTVSAPSTPRRTSRRHPSSANHNAPSEAVAIPVIRERSQAGNGNGENGDDPVRRRPHQLGRRCVARPHGGARPRGPVRAERQPTLEEALLRQLGGHGDATFPVRAHEPVRRRRWPKPARRGRPRGRAPCP